jgi:hypothetical protein
MPAHPGEPPPVKPCPVDSRHVSGALRASPEHLGHRRATTGTRSCCVGITTVRARPGCVAVRLAWPAFATLGRQALLRAGPRSQFGWPASLFVTWPRKTVSPSKLGRDGHLTPARRFNFQCNLDLIQTLKIHINSNLGSKFMKQVPLFF